MTKRDIRTYICARCKTRTMDHAVPGGKLLDRVLCAKCKQPMTHSTARYDVTVPNPKRPMMRVARKVMVQ